MLFAVPSLSTQDEIIASDSKILLARYFMCGSSSQESAGLVAVSDCSEGSAGHATAS